MSLILSFLHFFQVIKCLFAAPDSDLNVADEHTRTPLYFACEKGHYETALFLLQKQAQWVSSLLAVADAVTSRCCLQSSFG
jgi:ankyrin repeat protein